ncbi:hypothetical protein L207DRAFT_518594 [Hyaloscypha variabilis F]|uniref:Heterokaryon incompatibility domain-containing protein n=1 Tax=Hyaloscypha variabilis (strain UAMH 11265 / GT02V1 / F) TaxID=1149755 RepID=A0A2J6R2K4_HYAVF|nr:hypothetical protein L207DRAFT_518594 [Hyaloscypha variabilis F]
MLDKAYALYRTVCHEPENFLLRRFARTLVADTGGVPGISSSENGHKYPQDAREDYVWYRAYLEDFKHIRKGTDSTINEQKLRENVQLFISNQPTQWHNRSFFVTHFGFLGLCSRASQPGDIVCIFHSMEHPYILRKVPNKSSFTLISCAYCDGVMYGEALDLRDPAKDEIFIID